MKEKSKKDTIDLPGVLALVVFAEDYYIKEIRLAGTNLPGDMKGLTVKYVYRNRTSVYLKLEPVTDPPCTCIYLVDITNKTGGVIPLTAVLYNYDEIVDDPGPPPGRIEVVVEFEAFQISSEFRGNAADPRTAFLRYTGYRDEPPVNPVRRILIFKNPTYPNYQWEAEYPELLGNASYTKVLTAIRVKR